MTDTIPFEVLVIVLASVLLGGTVVAVKGVYSPGDLALFGGAAVAVVAAFTLTLLTLGHFSSAITETRSRAGGPR